MALYLPSDSTGLSISAAPDLRILLFTLGVTVADRTFVWLGAGAEDHSPRYFTDAERPGGAVVGGGHGGLRNALVVAQVSLSLAAPDRRRAVPPHVE